MSNEMMKPLDGGDQIEGFISGRVEAVYTPDGTMVGSRLVRPGSDTQPLPSWTVTIMAEATTKPVSVGAGAMATLGTFYTIEQGEQVVYVQSSIGKRLRFTAAELFHLHLRTFVAQQSTVGAIRKEIIRRLEQPGDE